MHTNTCKITRPSSEKTKPASKRHRMSQGVFLDAGLKNKQASQQTHTYTHTHTHTQKAKKLTIKRLNKHQIMQKSAQKPAKSSARARKMKASNKKTPHEPRCLFRGREKKNKQTNQRTEDLVEEGELQCARSATLHLPKTGALQSLRSAWGPLQILLN